MQLTDFAYKTGDQVLYDGPMYCKFYKKGKFRFVMTKTSSNRLKMRGCPDTKCRRRFGEECPLSYTARMEVEGYQKRRQEVLRFIRSCGYVCYAYGELNEIGKKIMRRECPFSLEKRNGVPYFFVFEDDTAKFKDVEKFVAQAEKKEKIKFGICIQVHTKQGRREH